jgi:hypothetical protein
VLSNGVHAWVISQTKNIREAINNVERHLEREYSSKLPKRVYGPLPTDYRPEVDITPELNEEELSYYQSKIGVLRWMVKLGRIPYLCVRIQYRFLTAEIIASLFLSV